MLLLAETGDGVPITTMTLDDVPDKDFWTPADHPTSALYLSHLAVDRSFSGHGVGTWMLNQAAQRAAHGGKKWLRLDAWKTNTLRNAVPALGCYHNVTVWRYRRSLIVPDRGLAPPAMPTPRISGRRGRGARRRNAAGAGR
ncbi:GNAT family N-acetyltransferase [Micromonospora sp. KC213]|uniref:GNAT family N-acetyltransferase n=1 Tax=Micromonospora sp. KC213 TaxID=2530378 RepID=UPI0010470BC7|nr:GNAT family N-acetyltransferase [Micromonospora sp. KC213]TDC44166.1 N-acetyltransferase [Micromonospora sp. KC213]